jgi:hypothetical protein
MYSHSGSRKVHPCRFKTGHRHSPPFAFSALLCHSFLRINLRCRNFMPLVLKESCTRRLLTLVRLCKPTGKRTGEAGPVFKFVPEPRKERDRWAARGFCSRTEPGLGVLAGCTSICVHGHNGRLVSGACAQAGGRKFQWDQKLLLAARDVPGTSLSLLRAALCAWRVWSSKRMGRWKIRWK